MSVTDYTALIQAAAARYGIPPALVAAVVQVESTGNPNATNLTGGDAARGGSYGLVQMSLDTAEALGYSGSAAGLLDPAVNLDLGAHYLSDLLGQTGGNVEAAVSAYNGGLSDDRPGDGKRTGNTGTAADYDTPFINQSYVDAVVSWMNTFEGEFPGGAFGAGAAAVIALAVGAWLVMRR